MSFALATIAHTPSYVFAILVVLVWQGIRALRTRAQPAWSLLIAPAAFAAVGIALLLRADRDAAALAAWAAAALLAAPLGGLSAPRILAVDRASGCVTRAGSAVPLLRNAVVFFLQYAVAVAQALHLGEHGVLAVAASAMSGASIGYATGWGLGFRARYRHASALAAP